MKREVAKNVDEYIAGFPGNVQKALKQLRSTIKKAAPRAEEKISYAIPCFTLDGTYLIYFAGFKSHVSVYPAPRGNEAFEEELSYYKGGKGTVQFPLDKPIPLDLVTRIVKFRIQQNAELAEMKKAKAASKRKEKKTVAL
jgi:uncharacterized protein YdhG (YjbR/CyaY superfamily)